MQSLGVLYGNYSGLGRRDIMNTHMRKIMIAVMFSLAVVTIGKVYAEVKNRSYVDGSKSFLEIKDVNRQAEAWALCAATYDVMAEILSEAQPARSQQLRELANGAEVAVTMAIVMDGLDSEISKERFNALWAMAKLAGKELPRTRQTMLAAEAESYQNKGAEVFLGNLSATIEVCFKNLEGQQMYIDTWREMAKSGLLQLPEK